MAVPLNGNNAREIAYRFGCTLAQRLNQARRIERHLFDEACESIRQTDISIPEILSLYISILEANFKEKEVGALQEARSKIVAPPAFGGLGIQVRSGVTERECDECQLICESWLESINSEEKAPQKLAVSAARNEGVRPMTLAQKIFSQHIVGPKPPNGLAVGDVVRVGVDWILASELSWMGMARTYEELGAPGIWRNDRFWLAGDHVVHPDVAHVPKVKAFVDKAEQAKRDFKMTEYQGMNYTIMHTEFVRERAEPGMLCIGSDSHTCSAGAMGCLAIGLGGADVMLTLSLGETWIKVPESILIELRGKPATAISGKDVILHILKELKRNTVAAERIVEFAGDGVKYLTSDARFAIANMCTEFGAITGVFVPDEVTKAFVERRRRRANKTNSLYFKPDADASYADRYTIDLSQVEPSLAVYPNPDDVVPVSEKAGMKLDGVFIGACTTTEEELVLGALVLEVGLRKNLPLAKGRRHYVPGSLPIVERLRELGLLEVYEQAGFTRGPPGCSFCVGLSAEKAAAGETWLSSQNRNFENRMGPGSVGHLSSAVVCAASSFSMSVTDPRELLAEIDTTVLDNYRLTSHGSASSVDYVEPDLSQLSSEIDIDTKNVPHPEHNNGNNGSEDDGLIESNIVQLGDFIDTDALAPGPTLTTCTTDKEFGEHVLEYTHPEFRGTVRNGQQVVVAGKAFGVGSSREVAVSALKGAGVKAVIARSFAFIYGRNQPSLGLLGFTIDDDEFYEVAQEGQPISIDIAARQATVGGRSFSFTLSAIEHNLTRNRGISEAFKRYGKGIWENMTSSKPQPKPAPKVAEIKHVDSRLAW